MTVNEWLTPSELGQLLGVGASAIRHRIHRGVYTHVKRAKGKGGQIWLIDIDDPALPKTIRAAWDKHVEAVIGIPVNTFEKLVMDQLQQIIELQKRVVDLLTKVAEKAK